MLENCELRESEYCAKQKRTCRDERVLLVLDRLDLGCPASLGCLAESVYKKDGVFLVNTDIHTQNRTCFTVMLGFQSASSFKMERHTVPLG